MEKQTTQRQDPEVTEVPLPAERAFVVQLRAQADPSEEIFVGRAEHIASGAEARFGSVEDLIAFITKVLAAEASAHGEPSASNAERGKPG